MYMHGSISYLLCLVATDTIFISMYICFASVKGDMTCFASTKVSWIDVTNPTLYIVWLEKIYFLLWWIKGGTKSLKKKKIALEKYAGRFKRDNCIFHCHIIVAFAHFWAFKHIFLSISSLIPLCSFGECKKEEWKEKRKQTLTRSRENVDTVASFHSRGSS